MTYEVAQWKRIRWGREVKPTWIYGSETTTPSANTDLVSVNVSSGKSGYVYGFYVCADEGNTFRIEWTSGGSAKTYRIVMQTAGAIHYADFIALNEGLPADEGTTITIKNVNAGNSGMIYQAGILYAETE